MNVQFLSGVACGFFGCLVLMAIGVGLMVYTCAQDAPDEILDVVGRKERK